MSYLYAFIPLSCVAAVISLGGRGAPIAMLCAFVFGTLCGKRTAKLTVFICTVSFFLRITSLYLSVSSVLGVTVSGFFTVLCVAVTVIAAANGGARYAVVPAFIISVILAVYTVAASFGSIPREFGTLEILEITLATVTPLGLSVAVYRAEAVDTVKRLRGLTVGILLSGVFVLFPNRLTEFGLLSVPVAIISAAIEADAVISNFRSAASIKSDG